VRLIERLLIVCVVLCGIAYGERLAHETMTLLARLDPAHLHGIVISGSALGFVQASIAMGVIAFAVIPAILSVFEGRVDGRRIPVRLVVGELVAALLLLGASEQVLHRSVHAHIVGMGGSRVLAVQASATTEVVE
jgi:hypothetical protein